MIGGVPILDYTPQTLLGITVLSVLFGWLVPARSVKQVNDENRILRTTNATLVEALAEANETSKVVRHFFDGLSRGADL